MSSRDAMPPPILQGLKAKLPAGLWYSYNTVPGASNYLCANFQILKDVKSGMEEFVAAKMEKTMM